MEDRRYINGFLITKGKRPDEWIVSRNGSDHIIYFERSKKIKDGKLFVDGEKIELPSDFMTKYLVIDHPVQIEDKIVWCVYDGKEFHLAARGEYVTKKDKYYPEQKHLLVALAEGFVALIMLVLAMGFGFDDLRQLGVMYVTMVIVAGIGYVYLGCLHKKEKKGDYSIISEEQRQIKMYKRRIWTMHILAFLSVIAMVVAVTVMNIEMPIIIWILMGVWFIGGERYVVHLWKKVRELERENI